MRRFHARFLKRRLAAGCSRLWQRLLGVLQILFKHRRRPQAATLVQVEALLQFKVSFPFTVPKAAVFSPAQCGHDPAVQPLLPVLRVQLRLRGRFLQPQHAALLALLQRWLSSSLDLPGHEAFYVKHILYFCCLAWFCCAQAWHSHCPFLFRSSGGSHIILMLLIGFLVKFGERPQTRLPYIWELFKNVDRCIFICLFFLLANEKLN